MSAHGANLIDRLERGFASAADAERARGMARYMRDGFDFYGIPAPAQLRIAREAIDGLPAPSEADLRQISLACWKRPQREWQYFACGYLRANIGIASSRFISTAEHLVSTKSWWDTVDALAVHVVGPLVRSDAELSATMDRWIDSENIWLARTALLHQNGYRSDTDAERLFDYCRRRAGDTEFFIRKAIGWALRQYSKTDEHAVRRFVRDSDLSGLSKREALKWLERGGDRPRARKRA
jgi:3-methyladenine DNA glycosylase AlkD